MGMCRGLLGIEGESEDPVSVCPLDPEELSVDEPVPEEPLPTGTVDP